VPIVSIDLVDKRKRWQGDIIELPVLRTTATDALKLVPNEHIINSQVRMWHGMPDTVLGQHRERAAPCPYTTIVQQ
jgi:hypothetical protein